MRTQARRTLGVFLLILTWAAVFASLHVACGLDGASTPGDICEEWNALLDYPTRLDSIFVTDTCRDMAAFWMAANATHIFARIDVRDLRWLDHNDDFHYTIHISTSGGVGERESDFSTYTIMDPDSGWEYLWTINTQHSWVKEGWSNDIKGSWMDPPEAWAAFSGDNDIIEIGFLQDSDFNLSAIPLPWNITIISYVHGTIHDWYAFDPQDPTGLGIEWDEGGWGPDAADTMPGDVDEIDWTNGTFGWKDNWWSGENSKQVVDSHITVESLATANIAIDGDPADWPEAGRIYDDPLYDTESWSYSRIHLTPQRVVTTINIDFKVEIWVENVTDLFEWEIALEWNPIHVTMLNFSFADPPFIPGPTTDSLGTINNTVGRIPHPYSRQSQQLYGSNGTGKIAEAWFQCEDYGTSKINLTDVTLLNSKGEPIIIPWIGTKVIQSASSHGYVHVSSVDPRFLVFDDGTPFYPIGMGTATWLGGSQGQYMKVHNISLARVWMCSWHINIEPELGVYSESAAAQLDTILALAEEYDIYIQLVLLAHTDFSRIGGGGPTEGLWDRNPYNSANGGPCDTPLDFLNNDTARSFIKKRFNYILNRWGDNSRISVWEFWNEVSLVGWGVPPRSALDAESASWQEDVAQVFRQNDTHRRPLTTSCHGDIFWDQTFLSDANDVIQIHTYAWSDPITLASEVSNYIKRYEDSLKPVVIGEYGLWPDQPNREEFLHSGLWSALASSSGGSSMWWWTNVLAPGDMSEEMWDRYLYFETFVRDIPWPSLNISEGTALLNGATNTDAYSIQGNSFALAWVLHKVSGTVSGAQISFSNLTNDLYNVYVYDDSSGTFLNQYEFNVTDGRLTVSLPDFTTHLAVKLIGTPLPHGPTARFAFQPNIPVVNVTVTFLSGSSPGWNNTIKPIAGYIWDFGDGFNTTETNSITDHLYTAVGDYNVTLTVVDSQGLSDTITRTITIRIQEHDATVTNITPMCHQAYTSWGVSGGSGILPIDVTVQNNGTTDESFSVSVRYNNGTLTVIGTKPVTLAAGLSTTLTFNWAVGAGSSMTVGSYIISANASIVSGETNTTNNELMDGIVTICFGGDANCDGFIGGYDATMVGINWWSSVERGHNADFNNDGFVGGYDATLIGINWWSSVPKP